MNLLQNVFIHVLYYRINVLRIFKNLYRVVQLLFPDTLQFISISGFTNLCEEFLSKCECMYTYVLHPTHDYFFFKRANCELCRLGKNDLLIMLLGLSVFLRVLFLARISFILWL